MENHEWSIVKKKSVLRKSRENQIARQISHFNVKVVLWWRRWGGRRTRFWLPRPSPPGSESGQGYFIRIVMKRKKMINKNWQHSSTSVIVRAKFEWILSKAITLLFWTDSIYNINININISTDIKLIFFERQQWQQRSIFFCFSSPQADCPRPERGVADTGVLFASTSPEVKVVGSMMQASRLDPAEPGCNISFFFSSSPSAFFFFSSSSFYSTSSP